MCRNIKTLFNFDPPATDDEIRAAAIEETFAAARKLMNSLETNAPPRDRDVEAQKAKERNAQRFGRPVET